MTIMGMLRVGEDVSDDGARGGCNDAAYDWEKPDGCHGGELRFVPMGHAVGF